MGCSYPATFNNSGDLSNGVDSEESARFAPLNDRAVSAGKQYPGSADVGFGAGDAGGLWGFDTVASEVPTHIGGMENPHSFKKNRTKPLARWISENQRDSLSFHTDNDEISQSLQDEQMDDTGRGRWLDEEANLEGIEMQQRKSPRLNHLNGVGDPVAPILREPVPPDRKVSQVYKMSS